MAYLEDGIVEEPVDDFMESGMRSRRRPPLSKRANAGGSTLVSNKNLTLNASKNEEN